MNEENLVWWADPETLGRFFPIVLVAFCAPFGILGLLGIYPRGRLVTGLAIVAVAACATLLGEFGLYLWISSLFVLVVLASVDIFTLPRTKRLAFRREAVRIASLRKPHRITMEITNPTKTPIDLKFRDDVPPEFDLDQPQLTLSVPAESRLARSYDVRPSRRGLFRFSKIYLETQSRWGLWRRLRSLPLETEISVYPDLRQISEYAILARTNRLSLLGVRRTRRVGSDNEFERLRDYTPDDNYKHIDWRSTARRQKLTVKDFQVNQSQRIIFLLDCGRMMTNVTDGVGLLDHSINAMLLSSYVALKQGDSVGLLCFSDEVHAFVPPTGGMNQMSQLLNATYDRFPGMVESRYDKAFLYLNTHCKKRTLVILVTNVVDEVNSLQIHAYLRNLVGRHLPVGILLRDHAMFKIADQEIRSEEDFYNSAAAAEILNWRHQILTDLEHSGVLVIDTFPEHMTAPLINTYLHVKARHLL